MVALPDFRGPAVEDGRGFPSVSANPAADLVVQVAEVEQQGEAEGQKKIFSNHGVLPADFTSWSQIGDHDFSGTEYRERQPACQ
jgi:hypothetical protein